MTSSAVTAPAFQAVLYPNRSLSQRGFMIVMAAVISISLIVGVAFFLIGAWPVTGLFGLDVLLLYLAFRWNYRQGRLTEWVMLDRDALRVRRNQPNGKSQEWAFTPYWAKVTLDETYRYQPRIVLSAKGERLTIGDFLSPKERRDLAKALQHALEQQRNSPA